MSFKTFYRGVTVAGLLFWIWNLVNDLGDNNDVLAIIDCGAIVLCAYFAYLAFRHPEKMVGR